MSPRTCWTYCTIVYSALYIFLLFIYHAYATVHFLLFYEYAKWNIFYIYVYITQQQLKCLEQVQTSHLTCIPNLMQTSKSYCWNSFALDSVNQRDATFDLARIYRCHPSPMKRFN